MQHEFEDNPNDLRETIEAAAKQFEEKFTEGEVVGEADGTPVDTSTTTTPADTTPSGESETAPAGTPADTPAEGTVTPPGESATPADTAPTGPDARAPGSWTPEAREEWGKLSPKVRSEVWKREREASRAMTMSTEARKFSSEFEKTVQPFMGFIAAEKATPLQAFQSLMQSGAILRVGTQQQKVALVADTIKRYGVDLGQLDSYLAGQAPRNDPTQAMQQMLQQQLAPIQQKLSRFEQQEQQQVQQIDSQIDSEIEAFANDPKNEFFADVQHLVADIMELADRQGQVISLTDAYQRATLIHEPVRRVIESRKQNQTLQQRAQNAAKARNAGSSVTSSRTVQNAVPQPAKGDNVRADIEAAIAAQQGR